MDLSDYRAEFTENDRYLDFAGIGPMSKRALTRLSEYGEMMTVSDRSPVIGLMDGLAEAQRLGAELFGTDASHIMFPSSTSHGLFSVAFGLSGGNVVVPANEFPANLYPWVRAAELGLIELRLVDAPDGRITADLLAPYVDSETSAVAISAVGYSTGYRADLDSIREVCGDALFVIDSVQASGAWPVEMSHGDVVVAGSQKWMRAGVGAALAGYSDRALERLGTTLTGWIAVEDMFGPDPAPHPALPDAAKFAMGSPPFLSVGAIRGALEVTLETGMETIEAAMIERSAAFSEALAAAGAEVKTPDLGPEERSTIFTFSMPGKSTEQVVDALTDEGFVFAERDGLVRVSPHATTPLETADALRKTLESLPA